MRRRRRARRNPFLAWPLWVALGRDRLQDRVDRLERERRAMEERARERELRRKPAVEVFCPWCFSGAVAEPGEPIEFEHARKDCMGVVQVKSVYRSAAEAERAGLQKKVRDRAKRSREGA